MKYFEKRDALICNISFKDFKFPGKYEFKSSYLSNIVYQLDIQENIKDFKQVSKLNHMYKSELIKISKL